MNRNNSKKTAKRAGAGFLCLLSAAFIILAGCGDKVAPGAAHVQRPVVSGVTVMTLAPTLVDDLYEVPGTVKAVITSGLAGRMMGTVTALYVKEGDRVQAGQLLLTIDDRDVQEKVTAAKAAYREALKALESAKQNHALADITHQRYKTMYEEKAISRQEMDQFSTQKEVASLEYERLQETANRTAAGLAEAQVALGFTRVTSPVTGVVTEKKIEAGAMAVPGSPLLTVENTGNYHVEIGVDEGLAAVLRVGAPVKVSVASIARQFTGRVVQVFPAVDPQSRTVTAKVSLSGAGLRSGLYATVQIPLKKKEILLVPSSAIVEKGQLTGIYTVDGQGLVTYRLVRVGKRYEGKQEIVSGLNRNERIIVTGVERAIDGGIIEQ